MLSAGMEGYRKEVEGGASDCTSVPVVFGTCSV